MRAIIELSRQESRLAAVMNSSNLVSRRGADNSSGDCPGGVLQQHCRSCCVVHGPDAVPALPPRILAVTFFVAWTKSKMSREDFGENSALDAAPRVHRRSSLPYLFRSFDEKLSQASLSFLTRSFRGRGPPSEGVSKWRRWGAGTV